MHLTEDETRNLDQFRAQVIALNLLENPQDHFLIRWLKARDLNVDKALIMLKKYIDWRLHNSDIISVVDGSWTPSELIVKGMKYEITGCDNNGRPIIWMPAGLHHTRVLCEAGHRPDLHRHTYFICEQLLQILNEKRECGSEVNQIVVILDMDQLYWSKVAHYETVQYLLTFFKEFEAYYPEILHSAYVVNAAWAFSWIFAILKPILSSRTLGKIQIFSSESKWRPALLSVIPIASLPKEYR